MNGSYSGRQVGEVSRERVYVWGGAADVVKADGNSAWSMQ